MAATTYLDLIHEVQGLLHSQTADEEEQTVLTQAVTDTTSTTLTVDDASQISVGLIEIDDELMWVKSVDTSANTVTLLPGAGRGYRETTATTHAVNALVINSPRYPRQVIRNAIFECIQQSYPDLFAVKMSETDTSVSTTLTYGLPADVGWIIDVRWQSVGPTKRWVPVRRWAYDSNADATAFANGKSIDIYDPMTPGRTIKVVYAAEPTTFANDTDTLVGAGFQESHRDVIVLGAAARLLMYQESARLQNSAVESSDRAQFVQGGAAMNAGRSIYQMYLTRKADETAALQRLYRPAVHLTR